MASAPHKRITCSKLIEKCPNKPICLHSRQHRYRTRYRNKLRSQITPCKGFGIGTIIHLRIIHSRTDAPQIGTCTVVGKTHTTTKLITHYLISRFILFKRIHLYTYQRLDSLSGDTYKRHPHIRKSTKQLQKPTGIRTRMIKIKHHPTTQAHHLRRRMPAPASTGSHNTVHLFLYIGRLLLHPPLQITSIGFRSHFPTRTTNIIHKLFQGNHFRLLLPSMDKKRNFHRTFSHHILILKLTGRALCPANDTKVRTKTNTIQTLNL